MSQLRWSRPDRGVLWPSADMEHDDAEQEGDIEDLNHDGDARNECGVNGPAPTNADDHFGVT